MMELEWDPEVESPATIAVIGAGPVGLEVAIYARFLGYFVTIFEERRVAHRMLDWHNRPLSVSVQDCTTSLGHAAIKAQFPDYERRPPDHVFTGKSFAEEYLVPLAKNDLLFDDIHFLSPVADVSRLQTYVCDAIHPQERCNDEFRIFVEGRHRGNWISRADVVIDCRGMFQQSCGLGPGGGQAMGEIGLRDTFLKHTPLDRKFEAKSIVGKRTCLIGQSKRAAQFATEFASQFANHPDTRLTWLIRSTRTQDSDDFANALQAIRSNQPSNMIILESLGVDQIQQEPNAHYVLRLMRDDDSVMELQCDVIASFQSGRTKPISTELNLSPWNDPDMPSFITREPGYYQMRAGSLEDGAGSGLTVAHDQIRQLFALISGRADLDLYRIVEAPTND